MTTTTTMTSLLHLYSPTDVLETFRACGVVAIRSILSTEQVVEAKTEVDRLLQPLLESRGRVRQRLKDAMLRRNNLRALWR